MGKSVSVAGLFVTVAGLVIAILAFALDWRSWIEDSVFQRTQLEILEQQLDYQTKLLDVQKLLFDVMSVTPQTTPEAVAKAQAIASLEATRTALLSALELTPTSTVDLSMGPSAPDFGGSNDDHKNNQSSAPDVGASSAGNHPPSESTNHTPTPLAKHKPFPEGNLITCVPPNPPNYAWIWIYRLNDRNQWVKISKGIGTINQTGYLKVDGLPVDISRFGNRGEPYRIDKVVNNNVVESVGDFLAGDPEFRIFPGQDSSTKWSCP